MSFCLSSESPGRVTGLGILGIVFTRLRLMIIVMLATRVSVEIDALAHGLRPFTAKLLVVLPLRPFDPGAGVGIGVARGVQRWTPRTW